MGDEQALAFVQSDAADDFLEHFGIKGQKWGIRRSERELQKARGVKPWEKAVKNVKRSVKERKEVRAHEKRLSKPVSKLSAREIRLETKRAEQENELKRVRSGGTQQNQSSGKVPNKRPSQMTTDELQQMVNRLRLEQQYAELTAQQRQKKQNAALKLLADIARPTAVDLGKKYLNRALGVKVNKLLDKHGHGEYKIDLDLGKKKDDQGNKDKDQGNKDKDKDKKKNE